MVLKMKRNVWSQLSVSIFYCVIFSLLSCGGGGGGGSDDPPPPPVQPTLGSWSGEDISFTLSQGSLLVDSLSVTYSGIVNTSTCHYDYTTTHEFSSSIQVFDNTFTWESPIITNNNLPELSIDGTFTSATTAEVNVTWSKYDSQCLARIEGSRVYIANYGDPDSSLEIDSPYLQYRSYENPSSNRYSAWIGITMDGEPIQSTEVVGFEITDPTGNTVIPTDSQFYRSAPYYYYNCSTNPCTEQAENVDSGYWANFSNLSSGDYRIEVEVEDGSAITSDVTFPGQLMLPIISSTTMGSHWSNGDLELSWTNPIGETNWDEVDQIRIVITTTDGTEVLYIRADPTAETITIPEFLVSQTADLGHGELAFWLIQTRAYDENDMNFARGYSNEIAIALSYKINDAYLQYRNYENPSSNRYSAWIGITMDGEPIQSTEVVGFEITDSTGNTVIPTDSQFYRSAPYYYYNCTTNPCTEQADNVDSGYWANFSNLLSGDYRIEVEAADGQKFTKDITYPGQLILPGVDIATMNARLSNGDLVLDWTNPKNENNWNEVDQLRIVLTATDGAEVLYIRMNSSAETVTIPESLITKVENLGHGTMDLWEIQTRAYDDNEMNFARGYSHN
jgi:hypothetical protein